MFYLNYELHNQPNQQTLIDSIPTPPRPEHSILSIEKLVSCISPSAYDNLPHFFDYLILDFTHSMI